jgi:hypothetical protein
MHDRDEDMTDVLVDKVIAYMKTLDLHGVVIASLPCPNCGQLHDFGMATDITPPSNLTGLLEEFVRVSEQNEPIEVEDTLRAD